ncbi:hypothetical protein Vretimale_12545 [Volvox reticuliferus]|uniref:Guanylate cyclase domain-containing protein n=1 Tax=Volvox reticuliferus TaxID=1737510 RepID=A0A8J4GIM5_9CHLO|nr:hypothetical protein Vretifemale_9160 [Volvox reticuliferus]GIM08537.1 hypothetical protein Vretimale_12545 [Volvox reticuliferus]
MRLKKWFCPCFQPVEVRDFSPLEQTQFQRGGSDAPNPFRHAQNGTSFGDLTSTARMVLCEAHIDSSPEPVSIYDWGTGSLLLSNAAFRNLPGGYLNLPALFALDPASLQDALSRVQAGLCWRGLIQLPAGLQSQPSLPTPLVPAMSSTRPSTGNGAIIPPSSPILRGPEVTDSAPIHSLYHASSSTMLRQALQLVAYPSLRLHGPPAAAAVATLAVDDLGVALQPSMLPPTDSFTQWRTGGGGGKMAGLAVTAVTADATTTAADTIAKATRAAALAKAAAQAAAAEAAAEAVARPAEAEDDSPASAAIRNSPTASLLPMPPQPAAPQVCLSSPDTPQPGVANLSCTLGSGGSSAATAAGEDDFLWEMAVGSVDPPSWFVDQAAADTLQPQPTGPIRPGSTSALGGAVLAPDLLGVFKRQQQQQQDSETPTGLHNAPHGFDRSELKVASGAPGAETLGAAAQAAAADRALMHQNLRKWLDGRDGWRLTTPLVARRGSGGDGGGGITVDTGTAMSKSSGVPIATEAVSLPQPLRHGLLQARRRNSSVQAAAQPALTPHSQNLLEALSTSTWGARINGRHLRPLRRAETCALLEPTDSGGVSHGDGSSSRGAGGLHRAAACTTTSDRYTRSRHGLLSHAVIRPCSEVPASSQKAQSLRWQSALEALGPAGAAGVGLSQRTAADGSPSTSAAAWASAASGTLSGNATLLAADQAVGLLPPGAALHRSCDEGDAHSSGSPGDSLVAVAFEGSLSGPCNDENGDVSSCGNYIGSSFHCSESLAGVLATSCHMSAASGGGVFAVTQQGRCGSGTFSAHAAKLGAAISCGVESPSAAAAKVKAPAGLRHALCMREEMSKFRRGFSGGLVTETAALRSMHCAHLNTHGCDGSGAINSSAGPRPGSSLVASVGGDASSYSGRTASPVGTLGVLPRMLDLASKVSVRTFRARGSASRLGQLNPGNGSAVAIGMGNGGGGCNGGGAASELGSSASLMAVDSGPNKFMLPGGNGGVGSVGCESTSSGPGSPAIAAGRIASLGANSAMAGTHGARQLSFSRFMQRAETCASSVLDTIRSRNGGGFVGSSLGSNDGDDDGIGGGDVGGSRSSDGGGGGGSGGDWPSGRSHSPSGERITFMVRPAAIAATAAPAPLPLPSERPTSPHREPADENSVFGGAAVLAAAAAAGEEAPIMQHDSNVQLTPRASTGGGRASHRSQGILSTAVTAAPLVMPRMAGSLAFTGRALSSVQEGSTGPPDGPVSTPPLPPIPSSSNPPLLQPSVAGHGAGGGAVMEIWHEVVVSGMRHPTTGEQLVMVTQHDVSARVWAEQQLARVMEAEHALLEAIFPAHVLEHIAIMAAAAGGDEADTEGGGGSMPQRPTLKGLTAAAYEAAEAAGLTSMPSVMPTGTSGIGPAPCVTARAGSRRREHQAPESPVLSITGDTFLHLATSHSALTVLFCDIQGFTTMCNSVKPATVMSFLNDLYTRLDAMLDAFGVYKVETIGDCYMVAGGLMKVDEETGAVTVRSDDVDPQHAHRTVQFAKALLHAASTVRLPNTGEPVRMRVGIHSGPAMSGVVGTRMPRFCLFGDTINTASRMESTGLPGAIHVSQATRDLTPNELWEPTGGVEAKGKGLLQTYLLRLPLEST